MKIKTHDLIPVEDNKFLTVIKTADTDKWGRCPASQSLSYGFRIRYAVETNTRNPPCLGQLRPDRSKGPSAPEVTPINLKMYYPLDRINPTAVITERRVNNRFGSLDMDREHPLWKQYEDCSNIFKVFLNNPIR